MRWIAGLAAAAGWVACGGSAFTTAPAGQGVPAGTDGGSTPDAATQSQPDASVLPDTGGDADASASGPDVTPVASQDATIPTEASMPGNGCPSGHGPSMVLVDAFCIDSTEVTTDQYNDFLLSGPSTTGQPAVCSWNNSYLPGNGWVFTAAEAELPIANVNWCDAYAFCAWAGKRLCGKVGGGEANFSDFAGSDNEHYMACSNGGTRVYPYGNSFQSGTCNGQDRNSMNVVAVASLTGCEGGVPGLFDMSGNVEEWQNACNGETGGSDQCLDGTGAFDFGGSPEGTRCDFMDSDLRNGEYGDVGFRCCAAPN
jgi:formylglycine-generating enzyme